MQGTLVGGEPPPDQFKARLLCYLLICSSCTLQGDVLERAMLRAKTATWNGSAPLTLLSSQTQDAYVPPPNPSGMLGVPGTHNRCLNQ